MDLGQQIVQGDLGVTIEHAGIFLVEERIFDAGIAGALPAFGDKDLLGFPDFENRHPGNRAVRIVLRCRVDDVVEPMTIATSVSGKSSLISSISRTMS